MSSAFAAKLFQAQKFLDQNTSGLSGVNYINRLTTAIAELLEVPYVFVGHLLDRQVRAVQTYGLRAHGKAGDNFIYELKGTPCENVLEHSSVVYADDVADAYPEDILLVDMGVRGYIGTSISAPDAPIRGLMVILHDENLQDTEYKKNVLELASRRAGLELERSFFEKELSDRLNRMVQFNHILSHDLRAPVANILGLLDMLDERPGVDSLSEIIPHLKTSGEQLASIMDDLSILLQSQKQESEAYTSVPVLNMVHKICEELESEFLKTGGNYKIKIGSEERVLGQPALVRSVIYNLTENAIKYRSPDRPLLLEIEGRPISSSYFQLMVKDNGIGIDMEQDGQKILNAFTQLNPESDGNGLGLFLVEEQLQQMGGHLSISSAPDKGTEMLCQFQRA